MLMSKKLPINKPIIFSSLKLTDLLSEPKLEQGLINGDLERAALTCFI